MQLMLQRASFTSADHLLDASAGGFIARTILANVVAYGVAVWWGAIFEGSSPLAIIIGQFLIVAVANFLVARTAPPHLTMRAMFGS